MAYNSGMLGKRAEILQRNRAAAGGRGRGSSEVTYRVAGKVWASLKWQKGMRPLLEGAVEAYDVVMIRMRWNSIVDRDCRIRCDGKVYQILQLNADKTENQIQIIAQEIVGETIIEAYSTNSIGEATVGTI